jgi:hypothetical protein
MGSPMEEPMPKAATPGKMAAAFKTSRRLKNTCSGVTSLSAIFQPFRRRINMVFILA